MSNILKFQKKRLEVKDLVITIWAAFAMGLILSIYLPDDIDIKSIAQAVYTEKTPINTEGDITGNVIVTDGDTIKIKGIRIRLHGIDAPEIKQSCLRDGRKYQCGVDAKVYLRGLINNNTVRCRTLKKDQYGRNIAKCYNYEDIDINAMMVVSGNAIAYLYYSRDYARFQAEAKSQKRGIWAGRFIEPYKYRKMRM